MRNLNLSSSFYKGYEADKKCKVTEQVREDTGKLPLGVQLNITPREQTGPFHVQNAHHSVQIKNKTKQNTHAHSLHY